MAPDCKYTVKHSVHKYSIAILLVILFDQVSKFLAKTYLPYQQACPVFPGLNWYLTYNRGISFSLFSQSNPLWGYCILGINIIITTVLLWLLYMAAHSNARRLALCLIIGGAMGNIFDRLYLHAVIDFIDVYLFNYHWYTFNIADAAITCGVVLFIADDVFCKKHTKT